MGATGMGTVGLTPLVVVQTTAGGVGLLLLGIGCGGVSQTTGAGGGSTTVWLVTVAATAVTVASVVATAALWFRSTRGGGWGGWGVTSPFGNEFTATHTPSQHFLVNDHLLFYLMGWLDCNKNSVWYEVFNFRFWWKCKRVNYEKDWWYIWTHLKDL